MTNKGSIGETIAQTPIRFGTDGWRGRMAEDYTFANVRRCAQGFANWLTDEGHAAKTVVVGHDKRFQGEHFASAVAEVLAGNGFRVLLIDDAAPTPVISFAAVDNNAVGAVNITASHNPPEDNGFKVRDASGGAVPPEGLAAIEARIPGTEGVCRTPLDAALAGGAVRYIQPQAAYLAHLNGLIDVARIRDAGLKIVVDSMWGNGAGWLSEILAGGKTDVIEIHAQRNPTFPEMARPEPIPPNVDAGLAVARSVEADCICILDGDADRCGFGDENGQFVDQLRVYGLLAYYLLEVRGERGPIVKTLSTTSMLDKLCAAYDVPVVETGVGFKYVAPAMLEHDALIGGEESGGYAFRGHVPERDGILSNLYLLDLMVRTGKRPTELLQLLFERVGEHYYDRIDIRLTGEEMKTAAQRRLENVDLSECTLGGLAVTERVTIDGYKFLMEDGGWLLVRFSGTEPLIRIYTETTRKEKVASILADGQKLAGL